MTMLYLLNITTRHEDVTSLWTTPEERDAALTAYVAEWWDEELDPETVPAYADVPEDDRVEMYFEHTDEESYAVSEFDMPDLVLASVVLATEVVEALQACANAAYSDSNDDEIEALNDALDLALARWPEVERPTGKTYNHKAIPDDDPTPGDRCKTCGEGLTWVGPSPKDWLHVDDKDNQ